VSGPATGAGTLPAPGEARAGDVLSVAFADPASSVLGYARVETDDSGPTNSLVALFERERTLLEGIDSPPMRLDGNASGWTLEVGGGAVELTLALPTFGPLLTAEGRVAQRCGGRGELVVDGRQVDLAATGELALVRAADVAGAALVRELEVWMEDGTTVDLLATRPRGAKGHDEERVRALVAGSRPDSDAVEVEAVSDPRLSTIYDHGEERPRRAGLELWVTDDADYPRRAGGEVVCAASVAAGGERFDCAFLRWHMDGGVGVGPYAIVRRD